MKYNIKAAKTANQQIISIIFFIFLPIYIYEDVGLHAFCLKRVQSYAISSTWTNKLSYI